MSVFGKLFSRKVEEPAPSSQQAMQDLQEKEELLLKRQDYLQSKADAELAIARANGTRNKAVALRALKQKNAYLKQITDIDGMLNNLQNMRHTLEGAAMNREMLDVLAKSSAALKAAHKNMDVDKVHDLMEDIQEQKELMDEINGILAPQVDQVEIDELEAELQQIEADELLDTTLAEKSLRDAPNAPTTVPQQIATSKKDKKQIEDEELAELEALMSS